MEGNRLNIEELMKLEKEELIKVLLAVIQQQSEVIKQQAQKISDLEARLNQNSRNS
jgi:hypothetical protein